jgi:hypothetical protein
LNTFNAGLNDFATIKCRVTLLSDRKSPRWTKRVTLGREWDRAFEAAKSSVGKIIIATVVYMRVFISCELIEGAVDGLEPQMRGKRFNPGRVCW